MGELQFLSPSACFTDFIQTATFDTDLKATYLYGILSGWNDRPLWNIQMIMMLP